MAHEYRRPWTLVSIQASHEHKRQLHEQFAVLIRHKVADASASELFGSIPRAGAQLQCLFTRMER
jgi:hypothetical protein